MDAVEAVMNRHMIPKVQEKRPDRSEIQALLDAAVRAPNHFLTEPWRFIVLTGSALDDLGEAMAERVRREAGEGEDVERRAEVEAAKPHRAPVIVVVVYTPSDNPKSLDLEDRYAVAAGVENMLIVAHAKGLGAYWRTGPAATDESIKESLGLADGEEIMSLLYVGHPEEGYERPRTRRTDAQEKAEWRGWD